MPRVSTCGGAQLLAAHTQDGEAPEGLDESVGHRGDSLAGRVAPRRRRRHARVRALRRARHRRRDHRRRRRAGRRHARVLGRAGGARGLRERDVVALEQARPRRPALPAELRSRARPRGAAGAPDQRQSGAAPGAAAALRGPRVRRRAAGPARRPRPQRLRRDGRRPAAALAARPPPRSRGARLEPGAAPGDLRARGHRAAACARATGNRRAGTCSTTARPTTSGSC